MGTQPSAQQKRVPAPDTFYVVKQTARASLAAMVTVLHEVPCGAHELASFEDPNGAIDFAESRVRELRAAGLAIEFIDPPSGLVGTG